MDKIDFTLLAKNLELDLDDIYMLFEIFCDNANLIIQNIQISYDTKNLEELYRLAHTLKGSASNLALNEFVAKCKQLEDLCKVNDLANIESVIIEIKNMFDKLRTIKYDKEAT